MGFMFPGDIGAVKIADADDFDDSAGNATFVVEISRNQIAKEGTDVPDPEPVTAELADDRPVRMGINQSMALRLAELAIADFDTLEEQVQSGAELEIQVDSAATDSAGDPLFSTVYHKVILNNVAHGPHKPDRSAYGVVIIDGMCTGFSTGDIYSLTHTQQP